MGPGRATGLLAALFGLTGVLLAALGSHAVPGMDQPGNYQSWHSASQLHLVHAVALLALSLQLRSRPDRAVLLAAALMALGIVLFCGSIYLRVWLGLGRTFNVAPAGGLLLMAGWAVYLASCLRKD